MAIKIKVIHAFCNVKQLWRTHGAGPEKIAVQFQWHWTCLAGSGRFKSRPEFIPAFSAGKEFMTSVVYQPTNGVATTAAVMTTKGFLWLCILFLFFTATTVAMAAPAPNVTGAAMAKPQELLQKGNISVTEAKYGRRSRKDIHDGFTRWVRLMGSLKHSVVSVAGHSILPAFHITVNKKGNADFSSIQQAIDSLPLINIARVVIKIAPGVYKEKVEVPMTKAFVTLQGSGADCTIIQWGDTATTIGSNGRPLGTFFSATVAVNAPFFIATNITFKNTSPLPESGAVGRQAVALRITGDMATFVGCNFLGAQDTLYDHVGRHYFKKCYIQGSVDFIFGDGLSLYQDCHLHTISTTYGALTAQKRESVLEATGFSFVNCKVTGSGALYLGRAWGTFSRVVFAYTYMDKIILPTGWYDWGDHSRDMTVFFGQYKCAGPGASFSGRVSWSRELTDEEAKPFISLSFIDGDDWIRL